MLVTANNSSIYKRNKFALFQIFAAPHRNENRNLHTG